MTVNTVDMGYSDGDVDTNRTDNPTLSSLVAERYSRRQTLMGGISATTMAVLGTTLLAGCDEKNTAPTVSAGNAITTSSGRAITLSGSAADQDGIDSAVWSQASGPSVTLTQGAAGVATFLAPSVAAATDLKFTLTATDAKGKTSTATATVTVMPNTLGFTAVPKNKLDVVTVPAGYSVQIGTRLGDPLAAGVAAYANDGSDSNFAQRIGDHGDALTWFGLSAGGARDDASSVRGLIVQNHENINQQYLHPTGATSPGGARPEAEALKEIECHGVSVTEFAEGANRKWSYVQSSSFNRRITPNTPTTFSGPVAGHALLKTAFSTAGTAGRGTINNCANGLTPWATLLTCEENWAGYFRRGAADNANRSAREVTQLNRYGVSQGAGGSFGWATVVPANPANTSFARWNATVDTTKAADGTGDFRYEPNQFGWVVEIDPYDKSIAPRKRTALGRFGHEGAWFGKQAEGKKLAVYMGDDSRGEYLYKFVSTASWSASDAQSANRMAMGDKYLAAGTLYVARFSADGSGTWLPLVFGQVPTRAAAGSDPAYTFADQADILTFPRLAADAVGATKMDRPEWTAVNGVSGEIYLTLTNNNAATRPLNGTDAANPRHYNDPRGTPPSAQFGNPNGHIIRLKETGDDHLRLGHLPVRRGLGRCRSGQRQPLGADRGQRLLQPGRPPLLPHAERRGPGQAAAVDPDRRRRLHRPHQQPDAGGAPRQPRRRRGEDDHQHRRRRRHRHPGDPRGRSGDRGDAAPLPRRPDRLRADRRRLDARRPHAVRRHPAPGRGRHHRRAEQPLARQPSHRHRRRHRPPALCDRHHHQG